MESRYILRNESEFPTKLLEIKPVIKGLWGRGNLDLVKSKKMVAIVGSRRMSQYGKRVLSEIVPKLIELGYVTISGFMYGIDTEMHRLTIENGGKTIGVFGWGIEAGIIPENQNLYNKVLESDGLFLSELEPKQLGALWTFPQRNRIVVGLADMVIVVEAGLKSGSLNSAEWGRKMGKPVYAVPGSIFSAVSEGCNWLLAKNLAKPMTMDFFKSSFTPGVKGAHLPRGKAGTPGVLNPSESNLITLLLIEGPQSLNELSRRTGKSVGEMSALLTTLLLKSEVTEDRGVWSKC